MNKCIWLVSECLYEPIGCFSSLVSKFVVRNNTLSYIFVEEIHQSQKHVCRKNDFKLSLPCLYITSYETWGWSGGAKVLGKLPVPGRPADLAYSGARAYCAFSRCGWGLFGHFFSQLSLLFSFSLSLGDGLI